MSRPVTTTQATLPVRRQGPVGRSTRGTALQAKLDVTPAGDRYEAEADRVAAQVMGAGTSPAAVPISALTGGLGGQRVAAEGKAKDDERSRKSQRAVKPGAKEEEKSGRKAQRDAGDAGGFTAPGTTERSVSSMQHVGGAPLDAGTRAFMEARLGRDFSAVQVHDDPTAHRAADDLRAHAFTVGHDIFFARDAYRPDTGAGRRLIAHELTHTIQQAGGSAQAKRVQRNGDGSGADGTGGGAGTPGSPGGAAAPVTNVWVNPDSPEERIDVPKKELTVPTLALPKIDNRWKGQEFAPLTKGVPAGAETSTITGTGPFVLHRPTERRGKTQRELWFDDARTGLAGVLADRIGGIARPAANDYTRVTVDGTPGGAEVFALRKKRGRAASASDVMVGTAAELSTSPALIFPAWNPEGTARSGDNGYQVDHLHELQLGGAHHYSNLWLLHAKANQKAGGVIKSSVETPVKALAAHAETAGFWQADRGGTRPDLQTFKKEWQITFKNYAVADLGASAAQSEYYTKEHIRDGRQLEGLVMMGDRERSEAGLLVDPGSSAQPTEFSIYPYATGGVRFIVRQRDGAWKLHNRPMAGFLGGFKDVAFSYAYDPAKGDGESVGTIQGTPKDTKKGVQYATTTLKLLKRRTLGYGVQIDPDGLRVFPRSSTFIGLSPVEFDDFGVAEDGLFVGHGRITASAYLFAGAEIPFEVHGDAITISFALPTDTLTLGPVSVDQASLELGFDSRGVLLGGSADVSVSQLGRGHLEATVGASGPRVEGDFLFDLDFLEDPTARFVYDMGEDTLQLMLQAGIPAGRIPGIAGGLISARFTKEGVELSGNLTPTGFLSTATIIVGYTRETGLVLEANDVPLPVGNLPAVRDARVSVGAGRSPEGVWTFYGSGSAQFSLPAVTGGVEIAVRDDLITFRGTGTVARGPATGTLSFTATNQEVDETGQPVPGQALDHFRTWGRGEVTVRFGSVLTGTAGIELTEDSSIVITGGLALPPTFEVFPQWRDEKQLLHIEPPEFPIWGVSIAGVGIGVFAFVDAYLRFDMYVGPGQLKDTRLDLRYDFMNPEDASVDGTATFDVPAGAGFTLDVGGGLRARLATAQVSGRVGLDARLGIQANAGAGVAVHWDPTDGLALDANAYARVSPQFEVGANASVTASVDLLVAEPSHTWGPWRQELGSFGPALSVGVEFPVSWSERNGLDLSLDDVTITKPEIDAGALMKDAFLELV